MIHSYSTAAMNRIALLSLNWWRPGDPRTPLSSASILEWCLRAFRRDENIQMHLIDSDSRGNLSDVVHEILTLDPTILGIGVYAWNSDSVKNVIKSIRELGFTGIIVLGGPEITFGNKSIFLEYPEADYCVRGEGEYAFEKIIRGVLGGDEPSGDGIFSKKSKDFGTLARNPPEHMVQFPHLNQELFSRIAGDGYTRVQFQRGCLYLCSFCAFRQPDRLFNEYDLKELDSLLTLLKERGIRRVAVLDPIFFYNKERARRILDAIRRIAPNTVFEIQTRIEHLDAEIIDSIKGMNIILECGVQTLDSKVQREIRRINDVTKVQNNLKLLRSSGIQFEIHLIYGLPFQTVDSFLNDVDFLSKFKPSRVRVFPLSLLKGTDLAEKAQSEYKGKMTFSPIFPKEVISTEWISQEDILSLKHLQEVLDTNQLGKDNKTNARNFFKLAESAVKETRLSIGSLFSFPSIMADSKG